MEKIDRRQKNQTGRRLSKVRNPKGLLVFGHFLQHRQTAFLAILFVLSAIFFFYFNSLRQGQVAGAVAGSFVDDFNTPIASDAFINQASVIRLDWDGSGALNAQAIPYGDSVGASQLLAYYNFNSYSREANIVSDSSSGGHNASVVLSVPTATDWLTHLPAGGRLGTGAFEYSAGNAFVKNAESAPFNMGNDSFAISFWMKADAYGKYLIRNRVRGEDNGFSCRLNEINYKFVACYLVSNGTVLSLTTPTNSVALNAWYHVVLNVDRSSNKARIYLNNVQKAEASIASLGNMDNPGDASFRLGDSQVFDGLFDEVSIWKKSLSDSEINALYQAGLGKFDSSFESKDIDMGSAMSGLKAYWTKSADGNIKVEATTDNGSHWCEMAQGGGSVSPNCLAFPASSFRYRVSLSGQAATAGTGLNIKLEQMKFEWLNDATYQCSDGADNDNDGLIDMADHGCSSPTGNDETQDIKDKLTTIVVSDNVVQSSVKRLGLNMGGKATYDLGIHMFKNLLFSPSFENPEVGTVASLQGSELTNVGGAGTNSVQQGCWVTRWNNDEYGKPAGYMDGARYEIASGPAKGLKGTVSRFYFTADKSGESRYTYQLDKTLPATVNTGDPLLLYKKINLNYVNSILTPGGSFYIPEKYIYYDGSQSRPGSSGTQSVRLGPIKAGEPQNSVGWHFDHGAGTGADRAGKMIIFEGVWRLSFWAKAERPGDKVLVQFGRLADVNFFSQTIELNDDLQWHEYIYDVNIPAGTDKPTSYYGATQTIPMGFLTFRTYGPFTPNQGNIWLDDVFLGLANETNPTVFSDKIVSLLQQYKPGILRNWAGQMGLSLDSYLQRSDFTAATGYSFRTKIPRDLGAINIPDLLELSKLVGAEPWINIPTHWTTDDMKNLMEFLGGPSNTPYGAKRAALGHPDPWTNDFSNIYLEFGNESSMGNCVGDPFAGSAFKNASVLAEVANDRFAALKSSPYFNAGKIKTVIGSFYAITSKTKEIEANSSNHTTVAVAPYFVACISGTVCLKSAADDNQLYGAIYAEAFQRNLSSDFMQTQRNNLSAGRELAIYEMNFHTTQTGDPPVEVRNRYVTSIGGGLAQAGNALNFLKTYGIKAQALFSFLQYRFQYDASNQFYVKLWGMMRDPEINMLKRPTWLSAEAANHALFGDEITTIHYGFQPTWFQTKGNGIYNDIIVPVIQSFAFKDGNKRSVVIFNYSRTETQKIQIKLPGDPGQSANMYVLTSSNINDNNENAENVRISTQTLPSQSAYQLTLSPFSMNVLVWGEGAAQPDNIAPVTVAAPGSGSYSGAQSVSLVRNEAGTTYYCLGNSCTPNLVYSSPILISNSTALKFFSRDTAGNSESVRQANYTITIQPACQENWTCGSWTTCANSTQTRTCSDSNHCGTTINRPTLSQGCTSQCSPNWICASWSACASAASSRTRTCSDSNNCNILTGRPELSQSCAGLTGVAASSLTPSTSTAATSTPAATAQSVWQIDFSRGRLVKTATYPAVYFVTSNNVRHLFVNEVTFFTWRRGSWKDNPVETVTQEDFDEMTAGPNIGARPGVKLIRFDNSDLVYSVLPSGQLCQVKGGYPSISQRTIIIQSSFENTYSVKSDCNVYAGGKYPDGTLIQYKGDDTIWYIENGQKRAVSDSAFQAKLFQSASIIRDLSTSSAFPAYPTGQPLN